MTIDSPTRSGLQRSLRLCLSRMAVLLYQHGYVLETVTIPHRGLDRASLRELDEASEAWQTCRQLLENSEAATYNGQDRFVLTELGRELLFDMFGQGAADST